MSDVAAYGEACLYLRTPGKVVTGWPSRPGLLMRASAWSHRAQPRSRALNTVPPCVQLSRLVPQRVVDGADNTPSRFLQSAHSLRHRGQPPRGHQGRVLWSPSPCCTPLQGLSLQRGRVPPWDQAHPKHGAQRIMKPKG